MQRMPAPWIFSPVLRRCAKKPSRFRWTIAAPDGYFFEHAIESYPTQQAAIEAGQARAEALNRQAALGYAPR